ncbi:MAG: DUF4129 domain-containing protein [Aquimonas sp.]|nr:DUF4129 domain-containing protein [Aquimonas sp.]
MRIDHLGVALRPRSGWEAVELGFALLRRHAGTVFGAWLLASLPLLALALLLGWALDRLWLAALLLWWLKPAFDRIPLFVLSRAVFGATPGLRETLLAQRSFGSGAILPWLLWRRLSPGRCLLLPADLLEGLSGREGRQRRSLLARGAYGHAALTLLVLIHVEAVLSLSLLGLGLMMVPIEFMGEAAQAMWETLFEAPPVWAEALLVLLYWAAVSLVEPFFVAAGFGLYLNRRTRLEAWDVELGLRRLGQRLAALGGRGLLALLLALPLLGSPGGMAMAAEEPPQDHPGPASGAGRATASGDGLQRVFGHAHADGGEAFVQTASQTYEDARLSPTETRSVWAPRKPPQRRAQGTSVSWLDGFARVIAFLLENALWLGMGVLLALLLLNYRRWLPALERLLPGAVPALPEFETLAEARGMQLPDDLPAAVRALWRQGRVRPALALFYAGSVQKLEQMLGEPLPPGATEADCLRRARRLRGHAFAPVFGQVVQLWQACAYAARSPSEAELEALLAAWPSAIETAP